MHNLTNHSPAYPSTSHRVTNLRYVPVFKLFCAVFGIAACVLAAPALGQPATPATPTSNIGATTGTNVQTTNLVFSDFVPNDAVFPDSAGVQTGTMTYNTVALNNLLQAGCGTALTQASVTLDEATTFGLINVIDLTGDAQNQTVKSNNWYIFSHEGNLGWNNGFPGGWKLADFDGATRLYGATHILLLSIVLNDSGVAPAIDYTVTITKAQATNLSDLYQLLSIALPTGSEKPAYIAENAPKNHWACQVIPVAYKTSTIKVDTSSTTVGATPFKASQTFANEVKRRFDVSFALPVKKASALQYSSMANTVTASQINKQSLFAVADFYPVPVDLSAKYNVWPSLFAGVAMNSQPLHSLLFGVSVGTPLVQIYAGALLLKQQQLNGLSTGSTASTTQVSSATTYGYNPSFSVGLKISIRSAASALSSKK